MCTYPDIQLHIHIYHVYTCVWIYVEGSTGLRVISSTVFSVDSTGKSAKTPVVSLIFLHNSPSSFLLHDCCPKESETDKEARSCPF